MMYKFLLISILTIISTSVFSDTKRWSGDNSIIQQDLNLIHAESKWVSKSIQFMHQDAVKNTVTIVCQNDRILLDVKSDQYEKVSTIYHGIFKLGFLFPHPRWQISPSFAEAKKSCGKTFEWKPAFKFRGFHLHTMHPSEFPLSFLEGKGNAAEQMVRWMARNRQNAIQLLFLRQNFESQTVSVGKAYALAKGLGITRGVSNGIANQQQNNWKLIPLIKAQTGWGDQKALVKSLRKLNRYLDYDYLSTEFGTSEFTSVNYPRALSWMQVALDELKSQGKKLFSKIHVSTNQVNSYWGNFNFLVKHSSKEIGILPHTVMFYGLYDNYVPMYGNRNFHHMLNFIKEEKASREVWYFPETSYWIGMDVDVPLLLTDYLETRATDMKNLHAEGIDGHMTFTTGHELGYWLFDWTLSLNMDLENNFDPLTGLKLLGEDQHTWEEIMVFQSKHFKKHQVIQMLSSANLQDEIAKKHKIHERMTMKELRFSPAVREIEIGKLEDAHKEIPSIANVKNKELSTLLEITHLRLNHALHIRKAMRHMYWGESFKAELELAKEARLTALAHMADVKNNYNRYPELRLFERQSNLTSYNFGYLWTAGNLHFWDREENMIRKNIYHPFFRNIYNFVDIIL